MVRPARIEAAKEETSARQAIPMVNVSTNCWLKLVLEENDGNLISGLFGLIKVTEISTQNLARPDP